MVAEAVLQAIEDDAGGYAADKHYGVGSAGNLASADADLGNMGGEVCAACVVHKRI